MQNKVSTNVINIFLESLKTILITCKSKENGRNTKNIYPLDEETRLVLLMKKENR
jgi:hypothetical protein